MAGHEETLPQDEDPPVTWGPIADMIREKAAIRAERDALLRENATLRAERDALLGLIVRPARVGPYPCWQIKLKSHGRFAETRGGAVAEVLRLATATAEADAAGGGATHDHE